MVKILRTLHLQYIPRNMHTVFALLCFVVVIHWLIFPYPSGLLHWHCGNLTIAPVPAKQPWWIWINTSCEFIMNDCITTTKQSTTKPCAYFLGCTVQCHRWRMISLNHVNPQWNDETTSKSPNCMFILWVILLFIVHTGRMMRLLGVIRFSLDSLGRRTLDHRVLSVEKGLLL